jgi:hypothetical protein
LTSDYIITCVGDLNCETKVDTPYI